MAAQEPMPKRFRVDRLWPDPQPDLDLDEAFRDLALPSPPPDRQVMVATNMVTSIDGRAQRMGTAEGLSGRADRRLMRLYRAAYDAVGSGIGTLRATDFWSTLPPDLAEQRAASGRTPQPLSVVVLSEENGADLLPRPGQDRHPLARWNIASSDPSLADPLGVLDAAALRIGVDSGHDCARHPQAAVIDLLVRPHTIDCTGREIRACTWSAA